MTTERAVCNSSKKDVAGKQCSENTSSLLTVPGVTDSFLVYWEDNACFMELPVSYILATMLVYLC